MSNISKELALRIAKEKAIDSYIDRNYNNIIQHLYNSDYENIVKYTKLLQTGKLFGDLSEDIGTMSFTPGELVKNISNDDVKIKLTKDIYKASLMFLDKSENLEGKEVFNNIQITVFAHLSKMMKARMKLQDNIDLAKMEMQLLNEKILKCTRKMLKELNIHLSPSKIIPDQPVDESSEKLRKCPMTLSYDTILKRTIGREEAIMLDFKNIYDRMTQDERNAIMAAKKG